MKMKINVSFIVAFLTAMPFFSYCQSYTEGFEDVSSLSDWYFSNNSTSANLSWDSGDSQIFNSYSGTAGSYISVGYTSTNSSTPATISNWLFTPTRTYNNGDVISFYTRTADVSPIFPDRLEVRFSSNGNGINVGNSATSVGTFTNVLLTINPNLTTTEYPLEWTQYTIIISGLTAPTNGRIALRYFITDGGAAGNNSNYIGIDSYAYTSSVLPASNDDCVNAININQGVSCIGTSGTTAYASESQSGCSGVANDDVWFKFSPSSASAFISVESSVNFDAVYEVFSGGSCGNLTSILCADAFYEGETEEAVVNNLIPGQNYFIRVYDAQDNIANTMTFDICIEGFVQCNLNQPSGSQLENETCATNTNNGCYTSPDSFFDVVGCNQTIYGNAWAANGFKDFDYYRFQMGEAGGATWNANSEFPYTISFLDITDCSNPITLVEASFNACQNGSINYNFPNAGTYAALITPTSYNNYPCNSYNDYIVNLVIQPTLPTINVAGNTTICTNSSVVLSTLSPAGTYQWLRDGLAIPNETNDSINANLAGVYTLSYTNVNGCPTTSVQGVTVSTIPLDDAGFSYPTNTVCLGSQNTTPTTAASGVFSVNNSGLIFTNAITGEIDVVNSTEGTYQITYTTNATCSNTSTQSFTISPTLNASFSYPNATYCKNENNPQVVLASGAGIGIFSSTNGIFLNSQTGEINLTNSSTGTYEITNTIAASGTCQASSATFSLTINGTEVNFPNVGLLCQNAAPVVLSASPVGGTFSGIGVLNNILNPSLVQDSTAITYTFIDAFNCSNSKTQTVLVESIPNVSFGSYNPLCANDNPIVLASGFPLGGNYSGNGVSNNQFNPSQALVGTNNLVYNYTTSNGCTSSVNGSIIVKAIPAVTFGSIAPVCVYESSFPITNVSPSGGSFSGQGMNAPNIFVPGIAGIGSQVIVYSVTQNGCSASANQSVEVQECAGLKELSVAYKAYPNPTNSILFIDAESELELTVYSLDGRKLIEGIITDSVHFALDLSKLTHGQYILLLSNENSSTNQKIILE